MYYQNPEEVGVHDGFPNPATDSSLQSLDLHQLLIKNPVSTFFVRTATGNVLLVDRSLIARRNDLVLWAQADTLKVSALNTMGKDGQIWGVVTATITRHRWNT